MPFPAVELSGDQSPYGQEKRKRNIAQEGANNLKLRNLLCTWIFSLVRPSQFITNHPLARGRELIPHPALFNRTTSTLRRRYSSIFPAFVFLTLP